MSNVTDLPLHVVLGKLQQVCVQAEAARQRIFEATTRLAALRNEEMQLLRQASRASGGAPDGPVAGKSAGLEERLPGMFVHSMPLDIPAATPARSRFSR